MSSTSSNPHPTYIVQPSTLADHQQRVTSMGFATESQSAKNTGPPTYHAQTRLSDGRPFLLIDPGSVGNLCGDEWAKQLAIAAAKRGHKPSYTQRERPLQVNGVGNSNEICSYNCRLPVGLRKLDGSISTGHAHTPTIGDSALPVLLGLSALRSIRAVLDLSKLQVHFLGL